MSAPDPLSQKTILSVLPHGRHQLLLTVSPTPHLHLIASTCTSSSDLHRLSVILFQLSTHDLYQTFTGVTQFNDGQYLVFEQVTGEMLAQRIARAKVNPMEDWTYPALVVHMQMMGNALGNLHANQLIHWKVNTRNFYSGVNNRIVLGGLGAIKVAGSGKFEKLRNKELRWLGSCFVAMVTKQEFEQVFEMDVRQQLDLCEPFPGFTGLVADMTKDALHGQWRGTYIPDEATQDDMTMFESSRVVLPPPPMPPSWRNSQSGQSLISVLAALDSSKLAAPGCDITSFSPLPKESTAGETDQTKEISNSSFFSFSMEACIVCGRDSLFSTPCQHPYCRPCFAFYIHSLTVKPLTAPQLLCQKCGQPLTEEFVFKQLVNNPVVHAALDQALLSSKLLYCVYCHFPVGEVSAPRNVTCPNCSKKFCSHCQDSPHYTGPCPSLVR